MLKYAVRITFEKDQKSVLDRFWLRRLVKRVLAAESVPEGAAVDVLIAGDDTVHRLNRDYRGKDRTTDVLSFALTETSVEDFVTPPDQAPHLGEVIISYPQAARQAAERGHNVETETMLLVVHGVLHLLGYDHEKSKAEERRMRAREKDLVDLVEGV